MTTIVLKSRRTNRLSGNGFFRHSVRRMTVKFIDRMNSGDMFSEFQIACIRWLTHRHSAPTVKGMGIAMAGSFVKVNTLNCVSRIGKSIIRSLFVECHRLFCSRHSIAHRHPSLGERISGERYNRHVHLDRIAEWERKAIERIRKQADDARRPLLAPPTPITETPPLTMLDDEVHYSPLAQLLTSSSDAGKQVRRFRSLSPSLSTC